MLRISWLFVSLGIPTQIRFGSQNGGNSPTKIWLRYKIFRKFTQLWALQNLILPKKIRRGCQTRLLPERHVMSDSFFRKHRKMAIKNGIRR